MDEERDPRAAERTDEQPEDLDVAEDDGEAVKGGGPIMQQAHEVRKGIVENLRA